MFLLPKIAADTREIREARVIITSREFDDVSRSCQRGRSFMILSVFDLVVEILSCFFFCDGDRSSLPAGPVTITALCPDGKLQ